MSLVNGRRIGPYEILAAIGAGGMGEVYRARDTRLHRDVAIKVLPGEVAADSERLARFRREAQVLASLNHPHIAAIYGVEDSDGVHALVLELVDGPTLADRILAGPVPLDEALPIASQIADAVEAAHELGIVHRDLKPANVKVRADGTVKVLDFGLAKAMETGASFPGHDVTNSPTITSPAHNTTAGVILGTAAYMSPEQARGRPADRRSDIWAFGALLYEMLTGRRAFRGDDVSETIASVLKDTPDLAKLPPQTPARVRRLIERCLQRDSKMRLRDIGEARIELSSIRLGAVDASSEPMAAVAARAPAWRAWLAWIGWAVAAATMLLLRWPSAPPVSSFELAIAPPPGQRFLIGSNSGNVTISPNGAMVAFVASAADGSSEPALWIRPIDRATPRMLSGTSGAMYPFWSPDSGSLGFFADRKLRTVEVAGGLPQVVADAPVGRGGCWGDDGHILFTATSGGTVARVSASGGAVTPVTRLDASRGENAHYWPTCLPGSQRFLYFARSTHPEANGVYITSIDGKEPSVKVVASLSSALYVPPAGGRPGQLLWARDKDLVAQPFTPASGKTSGAAVVIASDVMVGESQRSLMADVSRTGVLVWAPTGLEARRFVWFDRDGTRRAPLALEPGIDYNPKLSPDGRTLAFHRAEGGGSEIMLHDLVSGTTRRVTTEAGYNQQPAWLADGRGLIYVSDAGLTRIVLDGSAPPVRLLKQNNDIDPGVVTPDGEFLLLAVGGGAADRSLWTIALRPPYKATPLPSTSGVVTSLQLSPDGRWLMWGVADGARREIFLTRLTMDAGGPRLAAERVLVASGTAGAIGWRRDGRELYYLAENRTVMGAPFAEQNQVASLSQATSLFRLPLLIDADLPAVTSDGRQFIVEEMPSSIGEPIRVLTNWAARLDAAPR